MKKTIPTLTLAALLTGMIGQTAAQERGDRPARDLPADKAVRPDWESIKKRIEGAVERGDLTRDQANEKYAEIRERAGQRRPDARPDRPQGPGPRGSGPGGKPPGVKGPQRPAFGPGGVPSDALSKVLMPLVRQGKLTPMDVARIRRAAMAGPPHQGMPHEARPAPQHTHDRPAHGPRPSDEDLERLKNEMRETLEVARNQLAEIREMRQGLEQAHRNHEMEMAERHLHEERRKIEEQKEAVAREHREHQERAMRERAEAMRREMEARAKAQREEAMKRREREAQKDQPRERGEREGRESPDRERPERPARENEEKRQQEREREVR